MLECLLGLLKARHPEDFGLRAAAGEPRNFRESIERLFGEGICRYFMVPYNEKLLGVKLEEIRRVRRPLHPAPSLEDVVRGALGFSREALGYNARFVYPREGGIGALPGALAAALPTPPRYEPPSSPSICGEDRHTLRRRNYQLPALAQHHAAGQFRAELGPMPEEIQRALAQLRATTVHYFDLGVRGPGDAASEYHWIYFPEPEFIFSRRLLFRRARGRRAARLPQLLRGNVRRHG